MSYLASSNTEKHSQINITSICIFQKSVDVGGKTKYTLYKNPVQVDGLLHNLDIVEKILGDKKYLTGDNLTLADVAFVAWISTWNISLKIPIDRYPKITAWWKRIEKLPFYQSNLQGMAVYESLWATEE